MTSTEQRYGQIEKETDYLVGLQFHIETDHKPLPPLPGNKHLGDFPIRDQHFRMCLMHFSYTIYYVPNKHLVTADVLSRARFTDFQAVRETYRQQYTGIMYCF